MPWDDELENRMRLLGGYVDALETETQSIKRRVQREAMANATYPIQGNLGTVAIDQYASLREITLNMKEVINLDPAVLAERLVLEINAAEDLMRSKTEQRLAGVVDRY